MGSILSTNNSNNSNENNVNSNENNSNSNSHSDPESSSSTSSCSNSKPSVEVTPAANEEHKEAEAEAEDEMIDPESSSSSSSNSKPSVEVTPVANEEHKEAEAEDDCLMDDETLERVAKAKASIANDQSLPNVLSNFANLLQKPNLSSFGEIVSESKKSWNDIMDALKNLSAAKEIKATQVQAMEDIYNDYWSLLLRTRVGIEILTKKCRLQRRNVGILLQIIQSNNGVLSNDGQMAYGECIKQLGKWLGNDELDTLIVEWADMQTRLESQQKKWEKTSDRISSKKQKQMFGYLVVALAGVAIVALSATLIVATFGAAAPVVAGVVLATSCTVAEMAGAALVGTTMAAGGALGVWSTYTFLKDLRKTNERKKEVVLVVGQVQHMLAKMIASSKSFQAELKKAKLSSDEIGVVSLPSSAGSIQEMSASLKTINEHLDEYIRQGRVVIATVDKSCMEIINF